MQVAPCSCPELLDELMAEIDGTMDVAMEAIVADIPHYRSLSAAELAEVRSMAVSGSWAFAALWREGRLARRGELALFREHGAARAAVGRPLNVVLRAYRAASLAAYRSAFYPRAERFGVHEMANGTALLMAFVDQMCDSVTEGYVEASEELSAPRRRAARELLGALLTGHLPRDVDPAGRAEALGLSLPRRPRLLVLVRTDGPLPVALPAPVVHALTGDPSALVPTLLARGRLMALVELGTDARRALAAARLSGVAVDVGSWAALPDAYRLALDVVDLQARGFAPAGGLVEDREARLLAAVGRMLGTGGAELREAIAVLPDDLRESLWAYFRAGNAVSAAALLGVHPQTMRYRLRRVTELTGRSLDAPWDRFVLEAAVRADLCAEPT